MAVNINVPSQVKTYANLAAFPASGALKTIYIAEDTNKTYRWTGSVYVEVSASASGITIGTTAITSGTVGRVLFEGTGNVVQESANLFWDNTNGRLGIGTSSPAHTFQVYRNTSAGYLASFNSGATLNTNASLTVRIENANLPSLQGLSAGAGGFNTIAINPLGGNVLINTTTDAGFRLDVNGTARVQGALTTSAGIISNGTVRVTATTASPSGNASFFVFDGAEGTNFAYDYGTATYRALAYNGSLVRFLTGGTERARFAITTGNFLINTTTDAGFKLDVNGSTRIKGAGTTVATKSLDVQNSAGTSSMTFYDDLSVYINGKNASGYNTNILLGGQSNTANISFFGNNNIYVGQGNSTENIPSALIAMGSTTKGFLCPRMTTTQKNAIASPATGLQVFDTTLNRPCFYDGTTWITL